jgi:cyclase
MLSTRVIPCLLLSGSGLVKTVRFKYPVYLGDPRNVVKIFNEKEVDELIILDINATVEDHPIKFDLIREIVSEAFMPVAYGGGIRSVDDARKIIHLGVEKIVLNTHAVENPDFVSEVADVLGNQSVVVSIDVKRTFGGKYKIYTHGGRKKTKYNPADFAKLIADKGAGELAINSIDRDGTMSGYDLDLVELVTNAVNIPVIACGGAGKILDFAEAKKAGASAVAAGSLFVFQGKHRAVLISYPDQDSLKKTFNDS